MFQNIFSSIRCPVVRNKNDYKNNKNTLLNQWGSPIPFPTGGACVLSVIRFQDGGRRSAGGVSAEARI